MHTHARELIARTHTSFQDAVNHYSDVKPKLDSLQYLGKGASKSVYMLPCQECVIKLNHGSESRFGNQVSREVERWQLYKGTEYEHLFCPILENGTDWCIQPYAIPLDELNAYRDESCFLQFPPWLLQAYYQLESDIKDIGCQDIVDDFCIWNVGILSDYRVVMIDYGYSHW